MFSFADHNDTKFPACGPVLIGAQMPGMQFSYAAPIIDARGQEMCKAACILHVKWQEMKSGGRTTRSQHLA
jgi:hypothetical protein